jgi:hypothetical protein
MLVVQSMRWLDAKRIVVFHFLPPAPLAIHPSSSLFFSARLLLVGEHGTAGLGVEELVPVVIVSLLSYAPMPCRVPVIPINVH